MKKFIYLCGMMLLCMNVMAQIDPYDQNWDTIVFDDFDDMTLQFDNTFQQPDHGQLWRWISFSPRTPPSGVTRWSDIIKIQSYQAYQWDHSIIGRHDNLGVLKLCSEFKQEQPILCGDPNRYDLPPFTYGKSWTCDVTNTGVRFYSGMIESIPTSRDPIATGDQKQNHFHGRYRYGYFEIKLKSPVHRGCHSAFWLWDVQNDIENYYEAIDIFEYSWDFTGNDGENQGVYTLGDSRVFTSGIKYSSYSGNAGDAKERARVFPRIPDNEQDMTGWHVFSCEWLPERVTFYRDGQFVSQENDSIPSHPLTLKTTYSIDRYIFLDYKDDEDFGDTLEWRGTDTMYVDYIKVLQLKCDCDADKVIACQTDLDTLNFKVKKSYNISSANGNVKVRDTDKVTFRSTDYFEITGPFQTDIGGELTVIMQECPDNTINYEPFTKKDKP